MPIANSLLVFVLGAALLFYAIWCWRKVLIARQSPTIDVVILNTEIIEIHNIADGADLIEYQPKVTFSGQLNGAKIVAQQLCPDEEAYKFPSKKHAMAFAQTYPIGSVTQARILHLEPPSLILTSEVDWHRKSHYLAIAAGGVIIWAVIGILI